MRLDKIRKECIPWLYLMPACLFFGIFLLYPIFFSIKLSFYRWDGLSPNVMFVGIQNYARLFKDKVFFTALANTALYTAGAVVFQTSIGLLLAVLVNALPKGRLLFRTVYFLPVIMSLVIVGLIWSWFLTPNFGLVARWFSRLGLPVIPWLGDPDTALATVVAVHVWKWAGWSMVIYLAGIQGISPDIYEMARIEGANNLQIFWRMTVPLLKTATIINATVITIGSFKVFDLIYVMTQGGPGYSTEVVATYIFEKGFRSYSMGYASTLSCVLFVVIMATSSVYVRKMIRES